MNRYKHAFIAVLALLCCGALNADDEGPSQRVLEDFQDFQGGEVPSDGWRTRNGDAKGVYVVQKEDENLFLHAKDAGQSIQLFREGGWKFREYPVLSWRWRVHRFPEGADERVGEKNDSAAAVYVVFPNRFFVPEAIKYVWSEKVPEETKIARSHRFPTIVVRSGDEHKGEWVTEYRDVVADFVKHFGRRPGDAKAIGFLTDANAMKSEAEADYDDFLLLKKIPEKPQSVEPAEEKSKTGKKKPASDKEPTESEL